MGYNTLKTWPLFSIPNNVLGSIKNIIYIYKYVQNRPVEEEPSCYRDLFPEE